MSTPTAVGVQQRAEDLKRALAAIAAEHAPAVLASSLGAEDMVLTDAILGSGIAIEIFTLDTGRLHPETLSVLDLVRERYGHEIRVFTPDAAAVDRYVSEFGLDAIYRNVGLRRRCCEIRKVEPLIRRAGRKSCVGHRPAARAVGDARRPPSPRVRAGSRPVEVQSARRMERARGMGLLA